MGAETTSSTKSRARGTAVEEGRARSFSFSPTHPPHNAVDGKDAGSAMIDLDKRGVRGNHQRERARVTGSERDRESRSKPKSECTRVHEVHIGAGVRVE
eukprot:SAG22_NODE_129_length_18679_cov_40.656028_16_plen_99_part_00